MAEAGMDFLGGMDPQTMGLMMLFSQHKGLKSMAPTLMQQMLLAQKDKRSQEFMKGLSSVHKTFASGDAEGAYAQIDQLVQTAPAGTESLLTGMLNTMKKDQQQRQFGQALQKSFGNIEAAPPEMRGQVAGREMSGLVGMGGVNPSDVIGAMNLKYPEMKTDINQGAGMVTQVDPRFGTTTQQQIAPSVAPGDIPTPIKQGLADMGVSPSVFIALSNGTPEQRQQAAQLQQQAMQANMQREFKQQQGMTNIQVAGQKAAAAYSAAVHGAEQRKTFMHNQLNALPADQLQLLSKAAGVPAQPMAKFDQAQAQATLIMGQTDEALKAASKEAARREAEIGIKDATPLVEAYPTKFFYNKGSETLLDPFQTTRGDLKGRSIDNTVALDKEQRDQFASLQQNEKLFTRLKEILPKLYPEGAPPGTNLGNAVRFAVQRGLASNELVAEYDAYQAQRLALASAFQNGAGRSVSDLDVKIVGALMPSDTDSFETAQRRLNLILAMNRNTMNSLMGKPLKDLSSALEPEVKAAGSQPKLTPGGRKVIK